MTDRELLEMAARACGYGTSHPWNTERLLLDPPVDALCIDGVSTGWNPLTNDGHALRLAVKLQLLVNIDATDSQATDGKGVDECEVHQGCNAYAATRRAIVRAAAEIGKEMP